MSELPIAGITQKEQQRIMEQLYVLLGKQVKSYHKQRHMGENSSVPVELAQELQASVTYTLEQAGGVLPGCRLEYKLRTGQDILSGKLEQAKKLLQLVTATIPDWQAECRWDALRCLETYLASYDPLHLAHRIPEELFYSILISVPDTVKGIDHCLLYLCVMWYENQIMDGVSKGAVDELWQILSQDVCGTALNQCEQLLVNGLGKAVISESLDSLVFDEPARMQVYKALRHKSREELCRVLEKAAQRLCGLIKLTDRNAAAYVKAVVPALLPRLESALHSGDLSAVFL